MHWIEKKSIVYDINNQIKFRCHIDGLMFSALFVNSGFWGYHRKSASKCWIRHIINLNTIDHLNLETIQFCRHPVGFNIWIWKFLKFRIWEILSWCHNVVYGPRNIILDHCVLREMGEGGGGARVWWRWCIYILVFTPLSINTRYRNIRHSHWLLINENVLGLKFLKFKIIWEILSWCYIVQGSNFSSHTRKNAS